MPVSGWSPAFLLGPYHPADLVLITSLGTGACSSVDGAESPFQNENADSVRPGLNRPA